MQVHSLAALACFADLLRSLDRIRVLHLQTVSVGNAVRKPSVNPGPDTILLRSDPTPNSAAQVAVPVARVRWFNSRFPLLRAPLALDGVRTAIVAVVEAKSRLRRSVP